MARHRRDIYLWFLCPRDNDGRHERRRRRRRHCRRWTRRESMTSPRELRLVADIARARSRGGDGDDGEKTVETHQKI